MTTQRNTLCISVCTMKAAVLFLVARADPFFVLGRQSALR